MRFFISIFVSGFLLRQAALAYPVNPVASFTETILTIPIAIHFENLTVHHPLYEGIGYGTLPEDSFRAFIQQDDLYVGYYLDNFQIMANRESDPERAKYLQSIANEQSLWNSFFTSQYDQFKFRNTTQILPGTLGKPIPFYTFLQKPSRR